jgi:hypothetical protein
MKDRLHLLVGLIFLIGGLVLTFYVFATDFALGFGLGLCNSWLDPNCELGARAFMFLSAATIVSLAATILAVVATTRRRPKWLMLVATLGFVLTAALCALAATTAPWIRDVAAMLAVGGAILGVFSALTTAQWERVIPTALG